MEEVAFPQVTGGLLLKMCSPQCRAEGGGGKVGVRGLSQFIACTTSS